ncbi:NERD domain-containing protein, partial [Occultella gossypii]
MSLGDPASPAEAAALAKFRELLPDDGVTHAWANLTFVDGSGRTGEVDVLLLSRVGMFVVELKGWHGTISGNQQNWTLTSTTGENQSIRTSPFHATSLKAKRIASLLKDTAPEAAQTVIPFIGAKVVMHGEDSTIDLDPIAEAHVLALDDYRVSGLPPYATLSEFLATPPQNPKHLISETQAAQVAAIVAAAGFVATPKTRAVGQYVLKPDSQITEGKGWHDELASHPSMPGITRRIRLFDVPPGVAREDRQEIEQTAQRELSLTRGILHAGIESPLEFIASDLGPALIFDYDDAARPLDRFLTERGAALGFDARLALVRQIAEVVAYAHSRRLMHRALSPERVYVTMLDGVPHVRIRDWMTGRKSPGTSARSTMTVLSAGVSDIAKLVEDEQWYYLAPESLRGAGDLPAVPLDVYGLGALAYLVFTGSPPSKNVSDLLERIQAGRPLDAAAVRPDLPEPIAALIATATSLQELDRPKSVKDFGDLLGKVEDEVATEVAASAEVVDPVEGPPGGTRGGRGVG